MRAGIGYDIHRLGEGRRLFLGGEEIAHPKGLIAHSDGDVLLHAVCDAILGAAGLGDIGERFPDNDPKYRAIRSIELLSGVNAMIREQGWKAANVDSVIIAESPKISPFKDKMRLNIAAVLGLNKDEVNIKATTQEGVGAIGNNEAIAAYAVVLLKAIQD